MRRVTRPLTTAEVAARLQLTRIRVVQLADAGALRCWRTEDGQRIFEASDVARLRANRAGQVDMARGPARA